MRICIVGGIFDKPAEYRAGHSISPETVLAEGLRRRGWDVTTCGHSAAFPPAGFDIVHVHHFGRMALRLATAIRRPPFVFTTHDPFAMNRLPVGWKRRLTDPIVLRHADVLIAMSPAEREFHMAQRGIPAERIRVIPNGIDSSVFNRVEGDEASSDLLFVGQLRTFKGLDYLLKALPEVHKAYPHTKLKVVYQTGALLDHYRAKASQLGLTRIVDFAGAQSAAGLARLYSEAAVVVSPSLGECLSTVVLEAMCCGAPVVATDVGGIREQLDVDTGVIVPPRDERALAHAICGLLGAPDRRRRMGRAAQKKARAQFCVRRMIDQHVGLYEELLYTDERAA